MSDSTHGIEVGTIVYGFCNGVFGRDSYEDKIVIACGKHMKRPWAVLAVLDDEGAHGEYMYFAVGDSDFELMAQNLDPYDLDDEEDDDDL